ncbi:L-ribulose-5-phosphate 4-epimerase [Amycolatopsis balhimycina DSM 5908]|uniref:L-ribulose-5-phosphate 4-epimerase n=1 Tax=Amycolatopsis balhimycina DSM 5908 TaxID=1081091 RepID=A0A428WB68_AMYBA|nr:L-ribulose-5-phosphate 4-epimerase [Amycolatopsis balhimycina]RSM40365.1 L-ribulose-5-phosphate 4-epimerase [Amycolatopsis balhimycina DSM 5908]
MLLPELREQVCTANRQLPAAGLVTWTSGNVSVRDPETGLVVIKPSGRMFDDLTPNDMVVVDLDGKVVDGDLGPSSDTAAHLYVYANRDDVRSVIHTHSTFATAFATAGLSIPVYMTAIADEFGCEIPLGDYAAIGGDAIGKEICRSIGRSPAILMKQHGVFTIGASIKAALKAAVMVEDVAKTVWYASQLGPLTPLPEAEITANHERYTHRYGTATASQG